jgi:hypothetical protein
MFVSAHFTVQTPLPAAVAAKTRKGAATPCGLFVNHGAFPNDEALLRLVYPAPRDTNRKKTKNKQCRCGTGRRR